MPIRITGMNSGLDTESIITQLVSAKSAKKNSLVKAQTKLSWKMDAWKNLNSKIYGLYTNTISDMRFSSAYTQKKTSVSNASVASVIAGAEAANGVQTLKVNSLAKSGYLTGESLTKDDDTTKATYTASTKLSDMYKANFGEGDSLSLTLKAGGKETAIELTGSSTIGDVVKKLKAAGVNASFDENYQRFFISSTAAGKDADFSLTANDANGFSALTALGINVLDSATKSEYTRLTNMSDADKTAYIEEMTKSLSEKEQKNIESAQKTIEEKQKLIDEFWNNTVDSELDRSKLTSTQEIADEKTKWEAKRDSLKEVPENETEEAKATREAELKAVEARIKNLDALDGFTKAIETANDSIATSQARLANDSSVIRDEVAAGLDSKIAMAQQALTSGSGYSAKAKRIEGQDAVIELNGATFESSSNTFNINGLTITALAESQDEVTLTTSNDYEGVYDTIKKFIKGYNELINEMDSLYNAESSKGYEPLTSEEKEAMSDKEIEEWEKKIKDSLLRRDSTVNDVAKAMEDVMASGFEVGGKMLYLSNFGINTLGYFSAGENEKHAYHIDGDKDDTSTSANADVLKSMIASDPETVTEFFQKLSNSLYSTLTKKMGVTSMSSIYTAYNDKQMQSELDDYKTKIAEEAEKITEYEDRWYSKFSAMETALAKLNSKTSALSGLLGS